MKILYVAYHFPPIGGGGVQRNSKFVRYLPELGYEPVVVTGPGGARDRWTPPDPTLGDELPDGLEVHRVAGPEPEVSSGVRGMLERRLFVPAPFARWWQRGLVETALRVGRDCDLVYGSIVPYESGEAIAEAARKLGKPWIADLQDPWALDEMWLYASELHRRVDLRRMRQVLESADAVVMNTPEAAERVLHAFPTLRSRLVTSIPNGFDAADFPEAPSPGTDRFRIAHAGYLHTKEGLRLRDVGWARRVLGGRYDEVDILPRSHVYLLDALRAAVAEDPAVAAEVEVVLAGVVNDVDRRVAESAPVAVELPGYVDHAATIRLLQGANLLFLPMHDLPSGRRAGLVPGKTYEYLASGVPILAAVPEGDARDLLSAAGNAAICRPTDTEAMAQLLLEQIRRWRRGEPGPAPDPAVLAPYERRELTRRLAGVFDATLSAGR